MLKIKAKCIKTTYTWEKDNQQHKFVPLIVGNIYNFNVIDGVYYTGFGQTLNARGIPRKYFDEMFEIISEEIVEKTNL